MRGSPRGRRDGQGRRGAIAALATLVAIAAALGSCADDRDSKTPDDVGRPTPPVETSRPAFTFAPLVRLHRSERSFPISARAFLARSTLEWSGGACLGEANVAAGPVASRVTGERAPRMDVRRLGGRPAYRHRRLRVDCRARSAGRRLYFSTQHTRPYDTHGRPTGLGNNEGFNLDLITDAYDGDPRFERRRSKGVVADVPGYFERSSLKPRGVGVVRLAYWLLYARHEWLDRDGGRLSFHEGDWERVDVVLKRSGPRRYTPLEVRYHGAGGTQVVPWRQVDLANDEAARSHRTHPIVYSAKASHTPYPRPGARRVRALVYGQPTTAFESVPAACATCRESETWRQVVDVRGEPWYGYRGGWGARHTTDDTSGPAGPMPDRRWAKGGSR